MTAPHVAAAAQFRRRRAAAARMAPLEHSGARDPGTGAIPRREYMRPARPRKPAPHVRLTIRARAGLPAPPTTALDDLRALWRDRPDLRPAINRMAATLTDKETSE